MRKPALVEHADRPTPSPAPPESDADARWSPSFHRARRELWVKVAVAVAGTDVVDDLPGKWASRVVEDFDAFFGGG